MTKYWAPSSPGDLADRWTILQLKLLKAPDAEGRAVCERRLRELELPAFDGVTMGIVDALGRINATLWDLEDMVRQAMRDGDPSPAARDKFLQAARSIPILNDTRNHLKARIDELMGYADTQDVKFYTA